MKITYYFKFSFTTTVASLNPVQSSAAGSHSACLVVPSFTLNGPDRFSQIWSSLHVLHTILPTHLSAAFIARFVPLHQSSGSPRICSSRVWSKIHGAGIHYSTWTSICLTPILFPNASHAYAYIRHQSCPLLLGSCIVFILATSASIPWRELETRDQVESLNTPALLLIAGIWLPHLRIFPMYNLHLCVSGSCEQVHSPISTYG